MVEEIKMSPQIDYTKQQDLHPVFEFLQGNFSNLRKIAPDVESAHHRLDALRDNAKKLKTLYFKAESADEGTLQFFFGGNSEEYITGLVAILRDAGYKKRDIEDYVYTLQTRRATPYNVLATQDVVRILVNSFAKKRGT